MGAGSQALLACGDHGRGARLLLWGPILLSAWRLFASLKGEGGKGTRYWHEASLQRKGEEMSNAKLGVHRLRFGR